MNTCGNRECNISIMSDVDYCQKHKKRPKRRKNKKNPRKKGNAMFDASGRVAAGQGLARVKAQDKLRWEAKKAAEEAKAAEETTIVVLLTGDEQMQISAEMSKL